MPVLLGMMYIGRDTEVVLILVLLLLVMKSSSTWVLKLIPSSSMVLVSLLTIGLPLVLLMVILLVFLMTCRLIIRLLDLSLVTTTMVSIRVLQMVQDLRFFQTSRTRATGDSQTLTFLRCTIPFSKSLIQVLVLTVLLLVSGILLFLDRFRLLLVLLVSLVI